ncbi:MerR family transcriptional regulator [Cellulosimicrobium protaetiae]|uniref:MerR family transcriptional regulator n=1 Tax=Cellulosimicrobium protaetiae TaxID=2587808 RepID=A0A6M5UD07_9MICO|nr:MerR family transcriptional regulator [Cellulosimicrobium protaetiae]QJW35053.1 MerR family transcriptional regulator [Cellulosimicrobium protaetiae]
MDMHTTGQVARATGLSEKAVRLYVDRGLLTARRDTDGGPRLLDDGQVARARQVRLLREVDLSLAEVEEVLGAPDAVAAFDTVWGARRSSVPESLATGEYVRSVLAGHPYVEYHERATEEFAARVTVQVPVVDAVRPPPGFVLTTDGPHDEAYVALTAAEADDQARLVLVHDHLSSGHALTDGAPAGDNREIYLPTWAAGGPGPVLEVAVPVA